MSAPNPLTDPLVAATLVAASLTVLFSLWQPELEQALKVEPSKDPKNDQSNIPLVRGPLLRRALPLASAASLLLAILLHKALPIAMTLGCGFGCAVEDVEALYLLNTLVILMLTWATIGRLLQLTRLWCKLRRRPTTKPK